MTDRNFKTKVYEECVERMRAAISAESASLSNFITNNTYIGTKKFSFRGHEYQKYVIELIQKDLAIDFSVEKPSQTGLSEAAHRLTLAVMAVIPGFSVIFAAPSRAFASEIVKTRMSNIIEHSPSLSALVNRKVDSSLVKQFSNGSIVYAIGAGIQSNSSIVSRPADWVLVDELDRCDQDIVSAFRSRQTHSPYKGKIKISTPTTPDWGINAESDNKQIHQQLIRCHNCKHDYLFDYFEQIKLPGFDDHLESLTPTRFHTLGLDASKAFHVCPKCFTLSKLRPEDRHWVVENQDKTGVHVKLTPADAMGPGGFITPKDLVESQLDYKSSNEFLNQGLGLPSKLSDTALDLAKISFVNMDPPSRGIRVAGMDLGKTCHYLEGLILGDGKLFVDTVDMIKYHRAEETVGENIKSRRIVSMVSDSMPYQDMVYKLTSNHHAFWGAIYLNPANPSPELYKLKLDKEEGIRQVNIQKNLAFDMMVDMLMAGQIIFKSNKYEREILKHLSDMRKVRDYRFTDERYTWVKSSKGEDHFFHTLCYLFIASRLIMKGGGNFGVPVPIPGITPFKPKSDL